MPLSFHTAALLIEALGSAYLVGCVAAALLALIRGAAHGRLERARLLVADGAVAALSFKVAASLLKLAEVQTWSQIGLFVVTLALRTVLKRLFAWERRQLERGGVSLAHADPRTP